MDGHFKVGDKVYLKKSRFIKYQSQTGLADLAITIGTNKPGTIEYYVASKEYPGVTRYSVIFTEQVGVFNMAIKLVCFEKDIRKWIK